MVEQLMNTMRRVLVLAPHTDDAELGCGGTIARLLTDGADVFVAAFSTAEESLPPGRSQTGSAMSSRCYADVGDSP